VLSIQVSLFFSKLVVEKWQRLENSIEIIPWKVIQKHLKFGQFTVQLLAKLINDVHDFRNEQESIGS
jgi:hypothetical protein